VTGVGYEVALLDWLACAAGGRDEPAARAARTLGDGLVERAIAAGTAGHVLDFDDTYLPGLAHLSAPTAPAALVLAAELGATVGEAVAAYTDGFEAMARLTAANHPTLRERGWHPTAVCGVVGAAVACARLLELDAERRAAAARLALLGAAGLHAAFGSDGKSLQVGIAAGAGLTGARLAAAGATVGEEVAAGFAATYGARWVEPAAADGAAAIAQNWIKAWPCCLQTHGAIEAAARTREAAGVPAGTITVVVHPVSRQAAARDDVASGLEAKFSIPYLTAFTLLHGPPGVEDLRGVDAEARDLAAQRVRVRTDAALAESEAIVEADGRALAHVHAALGSPERPMDGAALAAKVRALAGDALDGVLDDPERPAAAVLEAAGLAAAPAARR
jgi:2-methylcitrate dehydratase PrpD